MAVTTKTTTSASALASTAKEAASSKNTLLGSASALFEKTSAGNYTLFGIDTSYGLGSILATTVANKTTADNYKLIFTDNRYVMSGKLASSLNLANPFDNIRNYNEWIRREEKLGENITLLKQSTYRNIGTVKLNANFELSQAAPLDARLQTLSVDTMVDPNWWMTLNKHAVYLYTGMVVAVELSQELFMYTGKDICIKNNDNDTKIAISRANWRRVSFNVEDIISSGSVTPSMDVSAWNCIYTNKKAVSAKADNGKIQSVRAMYITPDRNINSPGILVASDYIMAGMHYFYDASSNVQRYFYAGGKYDDYIGLTVIPDVSSKSWGSQNYFNNAKRVELQNVNAPVYLRSLYYAINDDKTVPSKKAEIIMDGSNPSIAVNAPSGTITLNANTLSLSNVGNISFATYSRTSDIAKINNTKSMQLKSGMLTMEISGGAYLSSGDETNIISGAFAVHTTGYSALQSDLVNSILFSPVTFDYKKGILTSNSSSDVSSADEGSKLYEINEDGTESINDGIDTHTIGEIPDDGNNTGKKTKTAYVNRTQFAGVTAESTFSTGLDKNNVNTVASWNGEANALKSALAPSTTSNFGTVHSSNLRIAENILQNFTAEVDNGTVTLVDLSDEDNLTNTKELVTYTNSASFYKDLKEKYKLDDTSSFSSKYLEDLDIKLLNTESQVIVNKELPNSTDLNGKTNIYDKGYTLIGVNSTFSEKQAQAFTELINNGTLTLESFGDVSIYSKYGHVKLGQDGFVRMSRNKTFVVQNCDASSYIRSTPDNLHLRYRGKSVADNEKAYIYLDTPTVKLWDGFTWGQPSGSDKVLTYSADDTNNRYSLVWKTTDSVLGSITNYNINDSSHINEYYSMPAEFYMIGKWKYNPDITDPDKNYVNLNDLKYASMSPAAVIANAHLEFVLTSGGYTGTVNATFLIYANKGAKVIVEDNTIQQLKLSLTGGTTINGPLFFKHIPGNQEILVYLAVPEYHDCHWTVRKTLEKYKETGVSEWEHVSRLDIADKNNNKLSAAEYINYKNYNTTALYDKAPDSSLECVYTRPLIFTTRNTKAISGISELPNDTSDGSYTLKFVANEGFKWQNDTISDNAVDVSVQDASKYNYKSYLVGTQETVYSDKTTGIPRKFTLASIHTNVYFDTAGDLHAGNFYSVSDKRLKDNIKPLSTDERKLPELKSFTLLSDNSQAYGYIAQELEDAGFVELVHTDNEGYKRVNYNHAYALKFKEMENTIQQLKNEIEILKAKL